MNKRKSFLTKLGELIDEHRFERQQSVQVQKDYPSSGFLHQLLRWLMPNGGTLLLVIALIATAQVWARPLASPTGAPGPSATTVNYQGRLSDSDGVPLDGTYGMSFALYDAATDGNLVWGPEEHTAVEVSDGLFSVGLGSKTSGGIPTTTWNGNRYLEITVGGETLEPRELIRSVPIAGMALTVPDGAISTEQIANGAVTSEKLALASASYQSYEKFGTTSADFVPIPDAEVIIDLDTDGKLLIIFAGDLHVDNAGSTVEMAVTVDGELQSPPKIEYVRAPANVRVTGSQSLLVDVEAGQHTVALNLRSNDGNAEALADHRSLTVLAIR
jgi:hypothetical protein